MVAADSFLKIFQSIASSWTSEQQLLKDTWGISIKDCALSVFKYISIGVASRGLTSIRNLKLQSKVVKIDVMNELLNAVDGIDYGSTQAVAKTCNFSCKATY